MKKCLQSIFRYIMSIKMKNKIILLCMLVILSSTAFTGIIAYNSAKQIIQQKVYYNTSETIRQSVNFLNEKLSSVLIQSHLLQTTSDFETTIKNILYEENINYALEFSRVEPILSQIKARERFIDSMYVYTPRFSFYNYTAIPKRGIDIMKTKLFNRLEQNGLIYWGLEGENEIFNSRQKVIPIVMKITLKNVETDDMYVIINLKAKAIQEYLSEVTAKTQGEIYIVNKYNQVVTGVEKGQYIKLFNNRVFIEQLNEIDNTGYFEYNNTDNLLINVSNFSINGWKMVSVQEEEDIMGAVNLIKTLVFLSAVAFITITALLSIFLASSMTSPINRLQKIMECAPEQHFTQRFPVKYDDEVGQLGTSFNYMSDQISTLLEKLKQEQKHVEQEQQLKRKAELKALQAQINPHFLYNALDSIYWRSMMQGNELVSEMAISLSNLFRMGLNKGKEMTTVYNELQHVENYLKIQKIIYEDKFDYTINAHSEVYECTTVKLILQPLVENSIVHGFEDMNDGGEITLNVKKEEGKICFEVIDNGKGFEQKNMIRILERSSREYVGYALGNVFQRIKLHYGTQYQFDINSVPYERTQITICIPDSINEEVQNV